MLSEYASASASVQQEVEFLRENMEKAPHSMMFYIECGRNCQVYRLAAFGYGESDCFGVGRFSWCTAGFKYYFKLRALTIHGDVGEWCIW